MLAPAPLTEADPAVAEVFFEDLEPGTVSTFGRAVVERDEMVEFARAFDAQPFHLDEAAAAASPVGRLIASGWFSCGIQMRMLCAEWVARAASLGAPGIEELRWLRPVAAGDVLSVRQTIRDRRVLRTRPDCGLVRLGLELLGQDGRPVMTMVHLMLIGLRHPADGATPDADASPERDARTTAMAAEGWPFPEEDPDQAPRHYDDIEIGLGVDLGPYTFEADRIVAFARLYDPQSFHLDPVAATAGPFGALAASGWHTGAAWMSQFASRLSRIAAASGGSARIGVSPGFRELRWLRPVLAGDTIRYATRPIAKRPLATRPGWGLLTSHNTGWTPEGELVFAFTADAFWQMREG